MFRGMLFFLLSVALAVPVSLKADEPVTEHPGGAGHGGESAAIDPAKVLKQLEGEGVEVEVHAAAHDLRQYVVTVRNNDFFTYMHFSLFSRKPAVLRLLKKLKRHDRVLVKGTYANSTNPQRHIIATDMELVEEYPAEDLIKEGYNREAKVPDELIGKNKLLGKVHAIHAEGRVFVIEYKDAVLPVVVDKPEFTKDLYRNDIFEMQYVIQESPHHPPHLKLDTSVEKPLKVIDAMKPYHQVIEDEEMKLLPDLPEKKVIEGHIVLFPKSPQIIRDIAAIQVIDAQGVKRNWTIIGADPFDFDLFTSVQDAAKEIWEKHKATAVNGRNKMVNYKVRVKATGWLNIVSANQANPQIRLQAANDLELVSVEK